MLRNRIHAGLAAIIALAVLSAAPAAAQDFSAFKPGPVFQTFGAVAKVDEAAALPADAAFKVLFDTSVQADDAKINRTLDSAARFINMHVAGGVPDSRVKVAVVIHGKAAFDLLNGAAFAARMEGKPNASEAPLAELLAHGVQVFLCGQTATVYGIKRADLVPGVEIALSAMTADALLQQQGYTLNPF